MAIRLINRETVNDDYEENMINKLKLHCGQSGVKKLETMRQDFKISGDLFEE